MLSLLKFLYIFFIRKKSEEKAPPDFVKIYLFNGLLIPKIQKVYSHHYHSAADARHLFKRQCASHPLESFSADPRFDCLAASLAKCWVSDYQTEF